MARVYRFPDKTEAPLPDLEPLVRVTVTGAPARLDSTDAARRLLWFALLVAFVGVAALGGC